MQEMEFESSDNDLFRIRLSTLRFSLLFSIRAELILFTVLVQCETDILFFVTSVPKLVDESTLAIFLHSGVWFVRVLDRSLSFSLKIAYQRD